MAEAQLLGLHVVAAHLLLRDRVDAGQRLEQSLVGWEGERHQGRPRLDDLVPEMPCDVIRETGGAKLGDRQPARREHKARRPRRLIAEGDMEETVAVLDGRGLAERGLDAAGLAFGQQHSDDLLRRSVAEQLAERLFVPGDPVPVDQSDEVRRFEPPQGRLGEMRIGRQEIRGRRANVGEIASASARNQDLAARLGRMIEEKDPASALPRKRGAKHPGRTGADNDCVKGAYGRHAPALAAWFGSGDGGLSGFPRLWPALETAFWCIPARSSPCRKRKLRWAPCAA